MFKVVSYKDLIVMYFVGKETLGMNRLAMLSNMSYMLPVICI